MRGPLNFNPPLISGPHGSPFIGAGFSGVIKINKMDLSW
jgi:hypothetical protein